MLRAVIIEDEELGRNALTDLITKYCDDVTIAGYGSTVHEGIETIRHTQPDIVFLDLQLGQQSGFDVIGAFPDAQFSVIITTAYDQFALEAFKYYAVSYLLKPIAVVELIKAVRHITVRATLARPAVSLRGFLAATAGRQRKKIRIADGSGASFFFIDEIIRLEAEGSYTRIVFKATPPFLASKNLGEFEIEFREIKNFIRIHRSCIINIDEVVKHADVNHIIMSDGVLIRLARRKRGEFKERVARV